MTIGKFAPYGMKKTTIPFEKATIKEYLDRSIRYWSKKRKEEEYDLDIEERVAGYYIDAFQSVRMTLFGEPLPED